jgi:hypothetical protein
MTWKILYTTTNGAFMALTDNAVDPLPATLAAKSYGSKPDLDAYTWDPSTLGLVPRTPQRLISKYVFIQRFTDAERRVLFGFSLDSTKTETQRKNVFAFERYLDFLDMISLDDTSITAGMAYLETVAILAAGRAAQILS